MQLLTIRRLQLAGHRPIGLVGGATGLIGDPSGKSAERILNPSEVVADWVERLRAEISHFLDFQPGPAGALLVSNLDWTEKLTALEFLRDIGKHFSVNQMIAREAVKARLEGPGISYTEFSYQILQANDYLELHRRHGCDLQVGGSDQWGNLVAGVDLIRRVTGDTVHALATPLITKPDGTKYGKTEGGTIWLNPELTSPYAFYQFWINRSDEEVGSLLRVFTFLSREEIEQLDQASIASKNADAAKVAAEDVVKRLDELRKQNEAAAAWGIFGTVIKWLGVVLSAVISFVTANPTLFAMTLALVVLTESGAMGKLTEAIGSALVAAGCDPAWSNIVAELIVTVIVIVASLGTQAIASGANAASAGSRLAQAGAKASAGLTAAAKAIPLVTIQSLLSSAVLMELIAKIPGLDKIPALQILLTLILMIVATVVGAKTMNASGKQGTMLQTVAQRFNKEILQATQSKIEFATSVAQFGATTAEGISTTGKSVMEIQLSDILKKLAGDKNVTQILELIATAFSQYADKSVKAAKESFTTYRPLFDAIPSFNKDMDAAAEALLNK